MSCLRFAILGVLLASLAANLLAEEDKPLRLLLLGQSPDGHPATTHEYLAGARVMAACLAEVPGLDCRIVSADNPWTEGPEMIAEADGVFLFVSEGAKWIGEDPRRLEAFARLAERGGGLVCLHWGMGTREAEPIEPFVRLFGGCHGGPDRKFKVFPEIRAATAAENHPTLRGIAPFTVREEFYYRLKFPKGETITPIITIDVEGEKETVGWAWERKDGGRSFGFSGGHFHENWGREEYRRLLAQGVLWSMKLPVPDDGLKVDIDKSVLQLPE